MSGLFSSYGNGILSTSVAVNQQHFLFTSIHFVNIAQWLFTVCGNCELWVSLHKFTCFMYTHRYCESIFLLMWKAWRIFFRAVSFIELMWTCKRNLVRLYIQTLKGMLNVTNVYLTQIWCDGDWLLREYKFELHFYTTECALIRFLQVFLVNFISIKFSFTISTAHEAKIFTVDCGR